MFYFPQSSVSPHVVATIACVRQQRESLEVNLASMLRHLRRHASNSVDILYERRGALLGMSAVMVRPYRNLAVFQPHAQLLLSRLSHAGKERIASTPRANYPSISSTSFRGLASSANKKGAGQSPKDSEEGGEGMFDRLKQTLQDELEKNPDLKENMSKMRQAEKKIGEETRNRMKAVQGEANKYAASAAKSVQKAGGVFQEKMEDAKQAFKENLGRIGGARDHRGSEDASGQREEAENDFVRASKEKFSGARRVLDENSLFTRVRTNVEALRESIANASAELFRAKDKDSAIVKKLKPPKTAKEKEKGKEANGDTEEQGEEEEEENKSGVGGLMIVKSAGEAWKRLQERLKDAPIIQDLLGASRVVAAGSVGRGAKAAKDAVQDKVEDIQEAWETSQHPMVYKMSSAWDSVTAESEIGVGVRELRRLDPWFSLEDWKTDIQEEFLPHFMSAFLRGDPSELEPWTSEACFQKLSSEIRQRKADGIVLDPHVLDVRQGEVVTIKADAGKANPTVAFQFMCQQINCVRNMKGEMVEGSEDDIRATYYMLAFQRDFMEEEAELRWKVVDIMVIGAFPWY